MIFKHIKALDERDHKAYKITHLDSDIVKVVKSEIKLGPVVVDTIDGTLKRSEVKLIVVTGHKDDQDNDIWEEDTVLFGEHLDREGTVKWTKDKKFCIKSNNNYYPLLEINDQLIHVVESL